jgi:biotin transport system substrate-specific component
MLNVQSQHSPQTLADALFPTESLRRDAILITTATLVTALCAQIAIPLPFTPVPITGQTFAVLLTGIVLGRKRALAALFLYLAEGACGLPVFAQWSSGPMKFIGPTAGYLLAFPIAAYITGYLAEKSWDKTPLKAALAMFLGSFIILTLGTLILSLFVGGIASGFSKGFAPFIPGDIIKTTLAAIALPTIWRVLPKKEHK